MAPRPGRLGIAPYALAALLALGSIAGTSCGSPPAGTGSGESGDGLRSETSTTTGPGPGGPPAGGDESSGGSSGEASGGSGTATTAAGAGELCAGLTAGEAGRVATDLLRETSGVVASERHAGVLWAHNDSGSEPAVFAVGTDGADLGRFAVPLASWVDVEDLAIAGGRLYLADIGDNNRERSGISVFRFDEPDLSGGSGIESVDEIRLRYPDGAHDAEAFLVDPATGSLLIIDKDVQLAGAGAGSLLTPAPASVFVAAPPFAPGEVTVMELAGTIALDRLATRSQAPAPAGLVGELGAAGVATGADLRRDGRVIAVRTYATVWLFARGEGQSIPEALEAEPCEAPTLPEEQGEAVAFLDGSTSQFVTIGEGANPPVNVVRAG
jgi:hypothetical protein